MLGNFKEEFRRFASNYMGLLGEVIQYKYLLDFSIRHGPNPEDELILLTMLVKAFVFIKYVARKTKASK